jgi:hypothetical protein
MSNTAAPKFIGKRFVVTRNAMSLQIAITQKVERWQETLLLAWILAWTFCGGVFVYELITAPNTEAMFGFRMAMSIMIALWFFIWWRTIKVTLWRLIGKEIITFEKGKVTIQNAFGKRGRKEVFGFENIFKFFGSEFLDHGGRKSWFFIRLYQNSFRQTIVCKRR